MTTPMEECPKHSDQWLYKAVRGNRRNMKLEPQGCTCSREPWPSSPALDEHIANLRAIDGGDS